ncbi:hypothetical protein DFJ73DRAFT_16456 [Zopfochytrium polystomum]|nr:hypothetical protein DFJ73DRAFT_16456 [Zopfochytrium polystomum]
MLKVWANCILENDYGASLDSPPVLPMFRGSRKKVKVARLAKTASGSGSELEDPRSALQTLHSNHPQLALQPNLTFSLDGIDKLFEAAVRKGKERASEEESLRRPSNMTIEVIIDEIVVDEFDRYELLELARTHRITPAALRCMTVETLVELGVHVGYAVQMISIAKR